MMDRWLPIALTLLLVAPAPAATLFDFAWESTAVMETGPPSDPAPRGGTLTGRGEASLDLEAGRFRFGHAGEPGPLAGGLWGADGLGPAGSGPDGEAMYGAPFAFPVHPDARAAGLDGRGVLSLSVHGDGSLVAGFTAGSRGQFLSFSGRGTPRASGGPVTVEAVEPSTLLLLAAALGLAAAFRPRPRV